jgi:S-formylglutathione hydrolase
MESYIVKELLPGVTAHFGFSAQRQGLFGHSMGGHGALTLALRHPGMFNSVSAFAPVCATTQCPWGRNAFSEYLGEDIEHWSEYDASALMERCHQAPFPQGILIDQGLDDKFLSEQLHPEAFELACACAQQPLTLRRHADYDHGYYFISTFVENHLRFHHHTSETSP